MKLFIYISIIVSFFVTSSVYAQKFYGEHIKSFDSQIQIQESGEIEVTETIQYDFGTDHKHGIFRTIPLDKRNSEGKTFRMWLNIISVTNEQGETYMYEESRNGGEVEIKIGDPDKIVTGLNTYIIKYYIGGALTYFSEFDELYWNSTGNEWSIPIATSSTTINLPQNIDTQFRSVECYTGTAGSSESNCLIENNISPAIVSTNTLNPREGITIVVTFPKHIVAELNPGEVISFWDTRAGKVTFVIIIIIAFVWYVLYPIYVPIRWFLAGRDPQSNIGQARALFDPPKTKKGRPLTPAETGTLLDEHAGSREISALLVDLARRGYIKIIENKKNDFTLEKTKEFFHDAHLRYFEKILLQGIFVLGSSLHLKDAKLYETVKKVQDELYESMVHEGYFPENPQKIRNFYKGIIGAAAITFNMLLLLTASIFGRLMPKKTIEGVQAANHARSLKNFLKSQERQLEFQSMNQLMFEKLLPFAVAFGVEKIWAQRFKDIDLKQPDWYVSSTHTGIWQADAFTRSLHASFLSFNSAAAPPTSSSGFSS
ncbi:MAG TPA: DUF2207 domain-containing protein, partial [Candidatus Woesebacteria bacterium]|nr:DUF2207 domain-containing protein [Candidatus Woesebacteria bacterium]